MINVNYSLFLLDGECELFFLLLQLVRDETETQKDYCYLDDIASEDIDNLDPALLYVKSDPILKCGCSFEMEDYEFVNELDISLYFRS